MCWPRSCIGPRWRCGPGGSSPADLAPAASIAAAAERGRVALTLKGFLKPEWSEAVYRNAARLWDQPAPDPDNDPTGYAAVVPLSLRPAPRPLSQRRPADGPAARYWAPADVKTGLQIDCMVCHGGSIGGQSYVGLGNTQLDLKALLFELTIADGRRPPLSTFVLNSSRGTNNAGQIAAVLLSLRNTDLSVRSFPLPLAVNLPEMDTPSLVAHEAQADDVLRRPHRRPLGPDEHAVPPGRKEPRRSQGARAHFSRHPGFLQESGAAEVPVPDRHGTGRPRASCLRNRPAFAATALTDRMANIPTRSFHST